MKADHEKQVGRTPTLVPLFRGGLEEIRYRKWRILQLALAAGIAWLIATEVFGHESAFFAPIAVVLVLGLTVRQRGRRAIQLGIGVAVGIAVADLIVTFTGTGVWQLMLVVGLAVTGALLLGGSTITVNQAAVSAVLVATLPVPDASQSLDRFLDALIGSGVALLANVITPADPIRIARRELEPLLADLSGTLVDVADALQAASLAEAEAALERARSLDPMVRQMKLAVEAGRETVNVAPARKSSEGRVDRFETAAEPIDLVVRDSRVLARGAVRATRMEENVPPVIVESIRDLAAAVRLLDRYLAGNEAGEECKAAALRAAALATGALEETTNMAASAIVAQVRATAADLLEGLGMDREDVRQKVARARDELES
jgi:uncharacterized membrane protein YgaE (UPF0421/DUF939 family)